MLTKKEMWPVMLTPFTERGEVDYNALERLIAFYEEGGCSGLFAICQSSEVFYLSLEERVKIADFVKKHARHGRGCRYSDYQPPGPERGGPAGVDG